MFGTTLTLFDPSHGRRAFCPCYLTIKAGTLRTSSIFVVDLEQHWTLGLGSNALEWFEDERLAGCCQKTPCLRPELAAAEREPADLRPDGFGGIETLSLELSMPALLCCFDLCCPENSNLPGDSLWALLEPAIAVSASMRRPLFEGVDGPCEIEASDAPIVSWEDVDCCCKKSISSPPVSISRSVISDS